MEVTQRQVCVQRKAGGPEELEEVLKCALAKKDLQEGAAQRHRGRKAGGPKRKSNRISWLTLQFAGLRLELW